MLIKGVPIPLNLSGKQKEFISKSDNIDNPKNEMYTIVIITYGVNSLRPSDACMHQ